MRANAEGKLHVCHQVEDYMFRPTELETMNFLDYTVETYEHRAMRKENDQEDEDSDSHQTRNDQGRYIIPHSKSDTHLRVHRFENHIYLPNIVGPWLPRRDGDEDSKPYYFAAMLSFLKPWRELESLKEVHEEWETAFTSFMKDAKQRDRDVVAGCQYYYESKNVVANREFDEERHDMNEDSDQIDKERGDEHEIEDDVISSFVSVHLL